MHVLFVYADSDTEWNCSQWRALTPSDALNKSKRHSAKLLHMESFLHYDDPAVQDIVGQADVIVVQRNCIVPEIWAAMDYWRGLRRAVVVDLDDDYPNLPWSNPAHTFWIENRAGLPENPVALLAEGLRHADALTSPSKVILRDWASIVPGIWVPNYAQGEWFNGLAPIRRARPTDQVVIGWGGSVSHYDSWWMSGVKDALRDLCKQRKQVKVKICGNDARLFEQLDIPEEQKILQPGVAPQEWPKVIATFDIGIAPLDLAAGEASYDNRRSWIKALEYLLVGVPWVASDSAPYQELKEYGITVENAPRAWLDALLNIVDNLPRANAVAQRNMRVGWGLTMGANINKLVGLYERAISLRQAIPALPEVLYVNWDGGKATNGIPPMPKPVTVHDAAKLHQVQVAAFEAAQHWADGFAARVDGVPVSDSLRYEMTQQINTILLEHAMPSGEGTK